MKVLVSILLVIVYIWLPAQNYGCFSLPNVSLGGNYVFDRYSSVEHIFSFQEEFDWASIAPRICKDGWYQNYITANFPEYGNFSLSGCIENGMRQGLWKIIMNEPMTVFSGNYSDNLKQGVWRQFFFNDNGDSICIEEVFYKDDLTEGEVKQFYSNGSLYRIAHYSKGMKHGRETIYSWSDSLKVGKILSQDDFIYDVPMHPDDESISTEIVTAYAYDNCKVRAAVDNEGKLNGILTRTFPNGIVAYKLECRNNKPYTAISASDISGRPLDPGTLKNGYGTMIMYNDSGKIKSVFNYRDQLISGEMLNYYPYGSDTVEYGLLFTDSLPSFKDEKVSLFEPDLNMAFAWTMNFSAGTDFFVYSFPGSKTHIYSVFQDTVQHDYYRNEIFICASMEFKGLKTGKETIYYDDGQIKSTGHYSVVGDECNSVSVKDGVFRYYYPNGILQAEVYYENDRDTGRSFYYDNAGNLRLIKVADNSGCSYSIFYGDTVNRTDACGLKQGKWIVFDYCRDGLSEKSYLMIESYIDGKAHGLWENDGFYHGVKRYYVNSDSAWVWYYSTSGIMVSEGMEVNSERTGEWIFYDNNGCLKNKGLYCNDFREGLWEYYNRKGKIVRKVVFNNNDEIRTVRCKQFLFIKTPPTR